MNAGYLVEVEGTSKKFCRSLKRSLWYGVQDIVGELTGSRRRHSELRTGEFWAVDEVSFRLAAGTTMGLIGPNGSGKTTLLRMLNGLIKPDRGRITVRGRMQALIALGAGFSPVLTGRENVYINASVLGIPKREVDRQYDSILEFAGIHEFMDAPVQTYSSGMVVRLGFAVAAHLNPNILLVDEVLAVGDEGFQMKCLNKIGELKRNGTAIILVSHNMHSIQTFSDLILLKTKDGVRLYEDVGEGVNAYKALFMKQDTEIEKICSGTDEVRFHSVELNRHELTPGDDLEVAIAYESKALIGNVEIDIGLRAYTETGWHYQGINTALDQPVVIDKGNGFIGFVLKNLRLQNTSGQIAVAIWKPNRYELLFWWRIPLVFTGVPGSGGANYYETTFFSKPDRSQAVAYED